MTFECRIDPGEPPGKVRWYREGREIYDSNSYQISRHGDVCKLVVTDTSTQDSGSYMCEVSNKSGIVDSSAKLNVQSEC